MKLLFAFGCGVKEKFVTLRPIEVRIAAIKREWGENPRLSRSCKFLYHPQTLWSTAKVFTLLYIRGATAGRSLRMERSQKTCLMTIRQQNVLGVRIGKRPLLTTTNRKHCTEVSVADLLCCIDTVDCSQGKRRTVRVLLYKFIVEIAQS